MKFTLELITNPDFRAWRTTGHALVRDITVVSPTEITWRMEEAFAPYLSFLTETFIVPKHILEKEADPNAAAFNQAPVGTGAFKWGSGWRATISSWWPTRLLRRRSLYRAADLQIHP